ncbi:MAG: hypothetical protein WB615_13780 [Candidatus Tumulicola sp.]
MHPNSPVALDKLGSVILHYNNMQSRWWLGVQTWTVAAKGVALHKINAAQAALIASAIEARPATSSVPETVALGLMASESLLDPLCQNGNFLGSNPAKVLGGFDMGLCQLKLKYITAPEVSNLDDAKAFAFDPTKAIPYFYEIFAGKIEWAEGVIAGHKSAWTQWNNPLILAVGAFKLGETGVMTLYQGGTWATELNTFIQLESWFASQLGVPSALA